MVVINAFSTTRIAAATPSYRVLYNVPFWEIPAPTASSSFNNDTLSVNKQDDSPYEVDDGVEESKSSVCLISGGSVCANQTTTNK